MGLLDGLLGGGGGGGKSKKAPSAKSAGFKLPSPEEAARYLVPIGTPGNPGWPGVGQSLNTMPGAVSLAGAEAGARQNMLGLQYQNQNQGLGNLAKLAMAAAMFSGGGGAGAAAGSSFLPFAWE